MDKITEILNVIFSSPKIDFGFILRLKKPLTDILTYTKENILNIINIERSNPADLERYDKLYLLILTQSFVKLFENLDFIETYIINNYESLIKERSNLSQINQNFNDLKKFLKSEISKTIQLFSNKSLNSAVIKADINNFIIIYGSLIEVCQRHLTELKIDCFSIFSKFENGNI